MGTRNPHRGGNALVEFVLLHRLGLRFVIAQDDALNLPKRERRAFDQEWRRFRITDIGQDFAHDAGVGD